MYSKLKKLSPLTLLFFIPLIPHFNVVEGFIHTDDLPILFFGIFILFNIKKLDLGFKQPVRIVILFIFIIYLLIQNQLVGNTFFNSEILRYLFYGILFIFVISTDINTFHEDIPFFLFLIVSYFSTQAYLSSFNFGTDLYNNWNIGLNLSDIDYIKGRTNGFQAGGPNSFADLITVTAIYSMFKKKDSWLPWIVFNSVLACFFTYSRFSLIVLLIFIIYKILLVEHKTINFVILILALLVCSQFGLIERFSSDDNSGIEDRVEMQSGTINFIYEDSVKNNLIGRGFNSYIVKGDILYDADQFNENNISYGPHNSYLFILLNYGLIGLLPYILIIIDLLYKWIKHVDKHKNIFKEFSPHFYVLVAFLLLSFSSDLLQNHSVSWFFYLSYFLFTKETENKESHEK